MITTKKELKFYIMADRIMNGYSPHSSVKAKLSCAMLGTGQNVKFLKYMRNVDYYSHKSGTFNKLKFYFFLHKYNCLSYKLGYDICPDCFGYGLVLPHIGTKVVGGGNRIGNYAVLHTSTCITAGKKVIGDGLYVSAGAKIIKDICLGDNITISANAVVNKNFPDDNLLLTGTPADVKCRMYVTWYERDEYINRVKQVEKLRKQIGIGE